MSLFRIRVYLFILFKQFLFVSFASCLGKNEELQSTNDIFVT